MPPASACVFCEILRGERDAAVVADEDGCVAFLDHRPLFPGHVLVVPREHHETLADLPPAMLAPVFGLAQRISAALPDAMDAHGSFVALNNRVSQSVPHLHVHVVPRRRRDGLRGFFWPRRPYEDAAAMEAAREKIARALARAGS